MNIVYVSDDNYADIMGISITSLLMNNKSSVGVNLYILDDNISDENKSKLRTLAASFNRFIDFIPMPDVERICGTVIAVQDWVLNAFARLFLAAVLPGELEKVIYIDCDTLILQPIDDLYNTNIEEHYCGGVLDSLPDIEKLRIGLQESDKYFNSGVLLINLKKWRDDNIEKGFIGFISKYDGAVPFVDQGVINGTMANAMKVLPPKYNSMTKCFCFDSYKSFVNFTGTTPYYREDEYAESVKHPVILHFTKGLLFIRPWVEGCKHPYTEEWLKYKSISPWADVPLRTDNRSPKQRFRNNCSIFLKMLPLPYGARDFYRKHLSRVKRYFG
jgi:lipopolysaccharide biosynthesis glycosyltransferase